MKHRTAACWIGLALLAGSIPSFAQGKDPAAADALFRRAREEMKKGDYAAACPKLAASQRLDPAPGTLLNLAQCEDKIGKVASAHQHFQDALEQLPPGDPRLKVARDGLASTRPRVPMLTVRLAAGAPKGTKVLRDDVELEAATLGTPLPVDPGEHLIVTQAPGHRDRSETVSLKEAESKEIEIGLGPSAATRPHSEPAGHAAADDGAPREPSGTARSVGLAVGAVGIVGVGLGGYFAWRAKSLDDQATSPDHYHADASFATGYYCDAVCYDKTRDSRTSSKIAYGAFVGGGVLIAAGLTLVLLAPSGRARTGSSVSAAVSPSFAGLQMGGTW